MKKIIFLAITLMSMSLMAAELVKVKGSVKVKNSKGKFVVAKVGAEIADGVAVKTGKRSLAILKLNSGGKLKINGRSLVKVRDTADAEVNLEKGSLFVKFKKQKGKSLRVRTKAAVAGVRGTEFFTSYGKKGNSEDVWLCVNEGIVDVTHNNSGVSKAVKAGEGIGIKKGKISDPKALPWTRKLNWSMDESSDDLENKVDIESAYTDLLDQDYD